MNIGRVPQFNIALAANLLAGAASAALWFFGGFATLGESQTREVGGTFSTVLLVAGGIAYIQSIRGKLHPVFFGITAAVAPGFAAMGGPLRTILSYHFLALLLHFFLLRNLTRHAKAQQAEDE